MLDSLLPLNKTFRLLRSSFLPILLLVILVSALYAAESKPKPAPKPQIKVASEGISLKWIEKGKLRMSATAKELRGNELTQTGELIGFSAKLYENGKLTSTMSAPKAVVDTANRIVTAEGGVKIFSVERKTSVVASKVRWFAKKQKIVGMNVKINSVMGIIIAPAFEADTSLKRFTVKDSVKF